MHLLALSFLILTIILFIIFVLISFSILGMYLSEIGLWFSWLPMAMIIISVIYTIRIFADISERISFYLFIASIAINLVTVIRVFIPFFGIRKTNKKLRTQMEQCLGKDYISYVDPFIASDFFKDVRFRFFNYITGTRKKVIAKKIMSIKDVLYKKVDDIELRMNVHFPKKEGIYPCIIFIHGGAFMIGSKDQMASERISHLLANFGYVVFNMDYRLVPLKILSKNYSGKADKFIYDMLSDIRDAMTYVKKNGHLFNGNPNELFLFGRSAGGHLALLSAFCCFGDFIRSEELECSIDKHELSGVVAFYPVTDFSHLFDFYGEKNLLKQVLDRAAGGDSDKHDYLLQLFSPITYVTEKNLDFIPPIFLTMGEKDRLVTPQQSKDLFKKLQEISAPSVLLDLPWANHAFDHTLNGPGGQLVLKYLTQFFVWVLTNQKMKKLEKLANEQGLGNIVSKEKYKVIAELKRTKKGKIIDMNQYLAFIRNIYEKKE